MINDFFQSVLCGDPTAICILVWCVLRAVLGIFELIATRNSSAIKKSYKEILNFMSEQKKGRVFSEFKDEYALNDNGELVKTGKKINVQDVIQSNRNMCMDKILDKFTGVGDLYDPGTPVYGDGSKILSDHKEEYANAIAYAEQLRERYHLDDYKTVKDKDGNEKEVFVEPLEVIKDLETDNELMQDVIKKASVPQKTELELEFEAYKKWKEDQVNA